MGLEDLGDVVSDLVGEFSEGIKDVTVDIEEFSRTAIEGLGDQGLEALGNGDLKGAIECSDMSEENKELANQIVESIPPNGFELFKSGLKIAAGALGTAAALATPGFQPAGLAAGAALIKGVSELATQLGSRNTNKNAAALANT